jgi:hypothetical protein
MEEKEMQEETRATSFQICPGLLFAHRRGARCDPAPRATSSAVNSSQKRKL